jgi:hypothetical protein
MILVTTYYNEPKLERAKEYSYCLAHNLDNPLIDKVVLLTEGKCNTLNGKLIKIPHHRPTIAEMFNIGLEYGDSVIVANADIYFDDTLLLAKSMHNEVWALSRIDIRNGKEYPYHKPDSQDVWLFSGIGKLDVGLCTIGMPGCDNRFVADIQGLGIKITNPCKSVNVYHYHNSAIRNYTRKDTVPPPHKTLHPSSL